MRLARLLTLFVSLALLGVPGAVGTASAAETLETSILIERKPKQQLYGHDIGVAGRLHSLETTGWTPVGAGHELVLERKPAGGSYRTVDSGLTDANGVVVFYLVAKSNAKYRIRYAGGAVSSESTLAGSLSPERSVKVARDLGAKQPKSGTRKIIFKGNVTPGWGKKPITLQRKKCKTCSWKTYDRARTERDGRWRFHTPAPRKGSWYFRTRVKSSKKFVTSYSAVLRTYRV